MFWLRNLKCGKSCHLPTQANTNSHLHRSCQLCFPKFTIVSAYGPAKNCNHTWFSDLIFGCFASRKPCQIAVGDFNWGPLYDHLMPCHWFMAEPSKPTSHYGTSPTGALSTHPIQLVDAFPIEGIPTHFATVYDAHVPGLLPNDNQTATRWRRCANFEWCVDCITEDDLKILCDRVDSLFPQLSPVHSLVQQWKRWHQRAECAFEIASAFGWANKTSKAERNKGSFPTTRSCEPGPAHRPPQTVLHRRLLRIHRALSELFRQSNDVNLTIPESTLARLNRILRSADHEPCVATCTLQAGLAIVNLLIQKEEKAISGLLSKEWRKKFRVFSQEIWKPAKSLLKPPGLTASFSAD